MVSAEVARALRDGAPVVALESTIISHGMPYPQNLATAQEVEALVREGALGAAVLQPADLSLSESTCMSATCVRATGDASAGPEHPTRPSVPMKALSRSGQFVQCAR